VSLGERTLPRLRATTDELPGLPSSFSAAVACGALQFPDALNLVKLRGECMEQAHPLATVMLAIEDSTSAKRSQRYNELGADAEVYARTQRRRTDRPVRRIAHQQLRTSVNGARAPEIGDEACRRTAALNSCRRLDAAITITLSGPDIAYYNARAPIDAKAQDSKDLTVIHAAVDGESSPCCYNSACGFFVERPGSLSRLVTLRSTNARPYLLRTLLDRIAQHCKRSRGHILLQINCGCRKPRGSRA